MLLAFGINLLFLGGIAYAGQAVAQDSGNQKWETICGWLYIIFFLAAPYAIVIGAQHL